jgi:hypothetical protein
MSLITLIVVAAAVGLLITLYMFAVYRHRRNALPPLILPVRYVGEQAPRPGVAPLQRPPTFYDAPARHDAPTFQVVPSHDDMPVAATAFERSRWSREQPPADDDAAAEGATIQFQRQHEEPVQLLPGRLEIEEGSNRGQEIRFVRVHGEPPEVTIGRGDGPPYRHIKLSARTVSRKQARLRFENGRWMISNLSKTNPTVVNGEELDDVADCRLLHDGDTIEMGEMVLRFRMG